LLRIKNDAVFLAVCSEIKALTLYENWELRIIPCWPQSAHAITDCMECLIISYFTLLSYRGCYNIIIFIARTWLECGQGRPGGLLPACGWRWAGDRGVMTALLPYQAGDVSSPGNWSRYKYQNATRFLWIYFIQITELLKPTRLYQQGSNSRTNRFNHAYYHRLTYVTRIVHLPDHRRGISICLCSYPVALQRRARCFSCYLRRIMGCNLWNRTDVWRTNKIPVRYVSSFNIYPSSIMLSIFEC
jgi:hypothetical protein